MIEQVMNWDIAMGRGEVQRECGNMKKGEGRGEKRQGRGEKGDKEYKEGSGRGREGEGEREGGREGRGGGVPVLAIGVGKAEGPGRCAGFVGTEEEGGAAEGYPGWCCCC